MYRQYFVIMNQEAISNLKELLEKDEIDNVLSILIKFVNDHNEFIIHKATLRRHSKAFDDRIISFSENNVSRNRIIWAILNRLSEIEDRLNKERGITRNFEINPIVNKSLRLFIKSHLNKITANFELLNSLD